MRHRDCEVVIKCDGRDMSEYDVQTDNNATSCYIASEAGKVFTIHCNNYTTLSYSAEASVDGRQFPTATCLRAACVDYGMIVCRESANRIRQLLFSEISVTDDESAANILPDASQLGLIQIVICRVHIEGRHPYMRSTNKGADNFGPLHETAKKGGMHCVKFGLHELRRITEMQSASYIDARTSPYIIFNFRYRPRTILQAQGILEQIAVEPVQGNDWDISTSASSLEPNRSRGRKRQAKLAMKEEPHEGPRKRPRHRPRGRKASSSASSAPYAPPDGRHPTADASEQALKQEDEEELSALQAQMQLLQDRMNRIEERRNDIGRSGIVKHEQSPIRLGAFHGSVIDLTDD